jgi:hypothetical protein
VEVKAGRAAANSLKALMRVGREIGLAYKVADANVGVSDDGVVTFLTTWRCTCKDTGHSRHVRRDPRQGCFPLR